MQTYNHNKPSQKSQAELSEILKILPKNHSEFKSTQSARKLIQEKIESIGWSGKVAISSASNITISSIKGDIGLCVQTGNVARYYADIVKLEYLFSEQKIENAILFVPTKDFAYKLYSQGGALTTFERVVAELDVFKKIIKIPIIVVGI